MGSRPPKPQLIDDLDAAQAELESEQAAAESARNEAAAERDELSAARDDAEAAGAEQQGLLDQVTGELKAELRRMTQERVQNAPQVPPPADAPDGPDGGGPSGPPPPGSGGGGAAAGYAYAQVGKAYCATSERFGPNCFDCSGLTYSSWQVGGLTIPLVSGTQGAAYPHVPLSQLQAGDLITTTSWDAHVGIWVGNGYVHASNSAPYPQGGIKFVSGSGSVIDAVRPS
jgi:peptidoglycan DL-endopeptidase CwlO